VFADAWLSGWLAEISADLRERWCSTTMRYTNPRLLYFTLLYFSSVWLYAYRFV